MSINNHAFSSGLSIVKEEDNENKSLNDNFININKKETSDNGKEKHFNKFLSLQSTLKRFKEFFLFEKRQKLEKLCEIEDSKGTKTIPLMTFYRVLKFIGFRLQFEELKNIVLYLKIYSETKDQVFYNKIIASIIRKLFKPQPFLFFPKMGQVQAVVVIQNFYKKQKNAGLLSGKRNPQTIIKEFMQKLQNNRKPLLKSFEEVEKNKCGYLDQKDLEKLLKNNEVFVNSEESNLVFAYIDSKNSRKIDFKTFISKFEGFAIKLSEISSKSANQQKILETVGYLKSIFKESKISSDSMFRIIDKINKGIIEFDDFSSFLLSLNKQFTQLQVRQIFRVLGC